VSIRTRERHRARFLKQGDILKKVMVGLGVGGALLAATALCHADSSSATVYGALDVYGRHATNGPGGKSANLLDDGTFYASRLGFQDSEDLGGGLRGLMVLEMGLDPSTGMVEQVSATNGLGQAAAVSGRAFGRQALVGLSGSYGTLTLGRQYTIAQVLSNRFQPQQNPNEPSLNILSIYHLARQDNMVKYANNFGPVGVSATYTASEGNGKSSSVGLSYTNAVVDLVAYGEQMDMTATGADTRKVYGAGGNYKILNGFKAFLGYMLRTQTATAVKNNILTGGFLYDLTGAIQLTLGMTNDRQSAYGTVASGRRDLVFAAAEYRFSKRSSIYLEADSNKVSGGYTLPSFMGTKGTQTGLNLGMDHRF
jgi:predicted porin